MPQELPLAAVEESTYAIPFTFTDDAGNAVAPLTASWSLFTRDGTVVNNREDEDFDSLTATETIGLFGDDLALPDPSDVVRIVVVKWRYNSDLGSNLPGVEQLSFPIEPVIGVPSA